MKKYDKEQPFKFEVKFDAIVKDSDYNVAMAKIIDEVNKLNGGEVTIRELKGEHRGISYDEAKQSFNFEIKIEVLVKGFSYDIEMKKIIEDVNNLNEGNAEMREIKGEHTCFVA